MTTSRNPLTTVILGGLSLMLMAGAARAQTPVSYSGDISPTFGSVNDTCAFEITLWDATSDGTRIGPVIERELPVRGGLYETDLDFGPAAVEGESRYLEVSVGCPAGTAGLTTLTRRAFHPAASEPGIAQDGGNTLPHAAGAPPKAALGTGFTYQGELKESGSPVTGLGDFQFSLWDALQGGNQIGTSVPASAIGVEDGRFTAQLDFGVAAFDGDARWLQIAVDYPSGTGSFTTLSPRQPLSAAPYALQTRGIFVDDAGDVGVGTINPQAQLEVAADGFLAMRVTNTSSNPGIALQASSWADSGSPVIAVDAYTLSPDGIGVYSFNEAETGRGYAVLAETNSPDGIAIFGNAPRGDQHSTGVGVFGRSAGDDGAAGVYGEATASGGTSYGVRGVAATGSGVYGRNTATDNRGMLGTDDEGVYGRGHGDDAGVRGVAAGSGPAGHFVINDASNAEAAVKASTPNTNGFAGHFTGGRNYFEGAVGIGTDAPLYSLDVDGKVFIEEIDGVRSGWVRTLGANGLQNAQITYLNGYPNNGYVSVKDETGTIQAGIWVNASGVGMVTGDVKSFHVPHPERPELDIWYASLEGPEAAMYVRGTGRLIDGRATITLPGHFRKLALESSMTMQLTPGSLASQGLAVGALSLDGIEVGELHGGSGSYDFHWVVTAVRRAHQGFKVIRPWTEALAGGHLDQSDRWAARLKSIQAREFRLLEIEAKAPASQQ